MCLIVFKPLSASSVAPTVSWLFVLTVLSAHPTPASLCPLPYVQVLLGWHVCVHQQGPVGFFFAQMVFLIAAVCTPRMLLVRWMIAMVNHKPYYCLFGSTL